MELKHGGYWTNLLGLDFCGGKDLLKSTLANPELHLSVERDNLAVLVSVFLLLATWDEVSNHLGREASVFWGMA